MKFYFLLQLALAILFLGLSVTVIIIVVEDNKRQKILRKHICLRSVAIVKAKPKKGKNKIVRF